VQYYIYNIHLLRSSPSVGR